MPTVRDFFAREAGDYLDGLDRTVDALDGGGGAPAELHRVSRSLRGSAQMARDDAIAQVAAALENIGRALGDGHAHWSPDLSERVRATLDDVRALLAGAAPSPAATVEGALARLAQVPVAAGRRAPASADEADRQFRAFAARESAAVLTTVESALPAIAADPMDREPLKAVLRRQRALMGAARLPSIPLLAETLTAIDEITRLVARLDVPVRDEWLEAYGAARDELAELVGALQLGTDVAPGSALLRLRTLRRGLLERHGGEEPMRQPPVLAPEDAAGAAVAPVAPVAPSARAPGTTAAPAPARTPAAAPTKTEAPATTAAARTAAPAPLEDARPVEEFFYRGDRALARALELRPELERAVAAGGAGARDLLAEVFDLIALGRA